MPNFTIESRRMKSFPDIQRTWLFELVIPNIRSLVQIDSNDLEDDIILRTRSVSIPGRGNEPITSNFMGMSQLFGGKPTFPRAMTVTFEETENQLITKFLYEWAQLFYNIDPSAANNGVSSRATKRELTKTVYINMYKYNGSNLDRRVKLWNAWPSNVEDVALSYADNAAVVFSTVFSYDFWSLVRTNII